MPGDNGRVARVPRQIGRGPRGENRGCFKRRRRTRRTIGDDVRGEERRRRRRRARRRDSSHRPLHARADASDALPFPPRIASRRRRGRRRRSPRRRRAADTKAARRAANASATLLEVRLRDPDPRAVRAGAVAARQARRAERVRSRLREQEKRAERRAELLRAELGEVPGVGCAEPEDAHPAVGTPVSSSSGNARGNARGVRSRFSRFFLTPHNRRVSGSGRSAATGTSVLRSASAKHASRANASSAARARIASARGVPPQTSRRARRAPRGAVAGAGDASRSAAARDAFAAARRVASLRAASTEARSAARRACRTRRASPGARDSFFSPLRSGAARRHVGARALVRAAEPLERPSSRARSAVAVHGAHTSGRSGLCAAYRAGTGVRERGARSERRNVSATFGQRFRVRREKRAYVADRGVRGQRRGGGDGGGQRRRSRGSRARPRVRGRGGTGGTPRLVGARRPVAGDRGSVPRETDTSATSFFPGKCLNDHEVGGRGDRPGSMDTSRGRARSPPHSTWHPSRPLGSGAGASPCAPAPRRVEYEALSASARARLRKSRARFHQSRTGRTLWVFFFQ